MNGPACAHVRVQLVRVTMRHRGGGYGMQDSWRCVDCRLEFVPEIVARAKCAEQLARRELADVLAPPSRWLRIRAAIARAFGGVELGR